jgi:hypothetical protein
LARIAELAGRGAAHREGEIRIFEDDVRGLPAQFEKKVLDRGRRQSHDRRTCGRAAGHGDHVDAVITRESRRHAGRAMKHAQRAFRQSSLVEDARELGGQKRRSLGRLEDNRVSRREGGRGLE